MINNKKTDKKIDNNKKGIESQGNKRNHNIFIFVTLLYWFFGNKKRAERS